METTQGIFNPSTELKHVNNILKQYKATRKKSFIYDYLDNDLDLILYRKVLNSLKGTCNNTWKVTQDHIQLDYTNKSGYPGQIKLNLK